MFSLVYNRKQFGSKLKMSVRKKCKCAYEILKNIVENRASFTSEQVIVSYPGEILSQATSTLSRINLKTQLLPRKRIKCSPSTLTSAFSKSSVFAVHTNKLSRSFQIYSLWRAFQKVPFTDTENVWTEGLSGWKKLRLKFIQLSVEVALVCNNMRFSVFCNFFPQEMKVSVRSLCILCKLTNRCSCAEFQTASSDAN